MGWGCSGLVNNDWGQGLGGDHLVVVVARRHQQGAEQMLVDELGRHHLDLALTDVAGQIGLGQRLGNILGVLQLLVVGIGVQGLELGLDATQTASLLWGGLDLGLGGDLVGSRLVATGGHIHVLFESGIGTGQVLSMSMSTSGTIVSAHQLRENGEKRDWRRLEGCKWGSPWMSWLLTGVAAMAKMPNQRPSCMLPFTCGSSTARCLAMTPALYSAYNRCPPRPAT